MWVVVLRRAITAGNHRSEFATVGTAEFIGENNRGGDDEAVAAE
jgi:hypothetical protein